MADKYDHWLGKLFGFFNRSKRYAVTFGQIAYYSVPESTVRKYPKWIKHENRHKEQYAEEGFIKFIVKYLWYSVRYGYKNNPFEVDARKAEDK